MGNPTRITYQDGRTREYEYDSVYRLTKEVHKRPNSPETGSYPETLDALPPRYRKGVNVARYTDWPVEYERRKDGYNLQCGKIVIEQGEDEGDAGATDE